MLIQALCEYYDILVKVGEIKPDEFSYIPLTLLISLTPEGKIDGVFPTSEVGKFPKRTSTKTTVKSELFDERPEYILGLTKLNSVDAAKEPSNLFSQYKSKFEKFRTLNLEFIADLDSPVINAFRNFLNTWTPESELQNDILSPCFRGNSNRCALMLSGRPDMLLNDDPLIVKKYQEYVQNAVDEENNYSQCAITGEYAPIARVHERIRGIAGAKGIAPLVSAKEKAYSSYGKEQGNNLNISVSAMHKYTEALNYLTGKQNHKHDVGDLTIVHWAVDSRPEVYDTYNDIFNQLIYGSPPDKLENESIETIVSKIRKGTVSSDDINNFFDEHNPNVEFYIVGLTQPSKGRISVKFILHSQFGQLFRNIVQHQQDLKTAHSDKIISLYQISQELSPPIKTNEKNKKTDEEKKKSQNAINFPLVTKLLYSVLNGYRYPNFLLQTVVRRIQLDSDTKDNQYIKMNDTRVGILKACINRDARLSGKEEKIKMALDLEYKNPAYLCGRLFAVLEDIQYKTYKASGRELNRTISDTYFTSASTRPATVFPRLIDMAKVYMAKPESSKYKLRDDERIGQIANELEHKYPNTLSLEEQGIFILGYYQQKQYIKDQKSANKEEK